MRTFLAAVSLVVALGMTHVTLGQGTQTVQLRTRLTPKEIASLAPTGAGAGTSGLAGIQTRVLKGDPSKGGLYTIELRVPANTRIEAHTHPDDRIVTVVSGIWAFGYGSRYEAKELKPLPPGSFYTEPPDVPHFAQTGKAPVVVHITGYGPTGTTYVHR